MDRPSPPQRLRITTTLIDRLKADPAEKKLVQKSQNSCAVEVAATKKLQFLLIASEGKN
ncbi:hypothetical protein QUA44_02055 [Microcoleus sp. N9_A2]|uniref:hypothetical protein n=1 Tax=unclassified Microcoleus TaxID=2642155 RepID=UPI002FCF9461